MPVGLFLMNHLFSVLYYLSPSHQRGAFLVEVTGFEPAASTSRKYDLKVNTTLYHFLLQII